MENYTPKNYKKLTTVLLTVTAAALIVCAACLALKRDDAVTAQGNPEQTHVSYYIPKPSASQENGNSGSSSQKETSEKASSGSTESRAGKIFTGKEGPYLITVYQGKIGVYRQGESTPFLTADVEVRLLPDRDLEILQKGLRAESFSEVKSILEDYE